MSLTEWQLNRLNTIHSGRTDYGHGRDDVTVVAYHFCGDSGYDAAFRRVECAIRETWLHCGMMKTSLIVNEARPCATEFAELFPSVSLQVEPTLMPGSIFTMSADMNGRLATRFNTEYCLVVQNDGFPIRSGLDEFIGRFDFIGAPYIRNIWWKQMIAKILNCHVQNGGFSLRSHAICERAAYYWNKKYFAMGDVKNSSEDLFYTKFLPLHEYNYWRKFKLASYFPALHFSYDAAIPIKTPEYLPFGFHREESFHALRHAMAT